MLSKELSCKISRIILSLILLIPLIGTSSVEARIYETKDCPVKFDVPSDLELRDVVGWTEPVKKIACRISVVRKAKRNPPLPDKSFDDVRYLSDVVLIVKTIPLKSRLSEFNFVVRDNHITYKGVAVSNDAKSMGYQVLQTRPIEYYTVGRGDMYVGIQDFIQRGSKERKENRSVSYVFLLGNEKYSIDVELTYRDNSDYSQVKKSSILKLLRSAKFNFDE